MSVRVMGGDDGVTFIVCTICAPVGTFPVSICLSSRSLQYHVFVRLHVNSCFYCAEWNSFWKRKLRGWFQKRWGCFHLHGIQKCKVTFYLDFPQIYNRNPLFNNFNYSENNLFANIFLTENISFCTEQDNQILQFD